MTNGISEISSLANGTATPVSFLLKLCNLINKINITHNRMIFNYNNFKTIY